MFKYILKRLALMLVILLIATTMCFMLIRLLPREIPQDVTLQAVIAARWEALGYNEPLLVQYFIYLKGIFTSFDFGTSWQIQMLEPALDLITSRLLPTVLVNFYAFLISIPLAIGLGIFAALRKNTMTDHVISTMVVIFVSIPSYVTAFIVQYLLCYKFNIFPLNMSSLYDAGGSYFTWAMFTSMIPAVISLSFFEIAGLTRSVRAELTETLTSDYMLLARTKGLTKAQATKRHALKNAMVPILPGIIGMFISILSGSIIIEKIFSIPGVGQLYLLSISQLDYDVFMMITIFYSAVGLLASILVDISYGFIDPRIRMGEK